jgi:uncharacterized protein
MPGLSQQLEFDPGDEVLGPPDASDYFFEGYMTSVAVCPVDIPPVEVLSILPESEEKQAIDPAEIAGTIERLRDMMALAPDEYEPMHIGEGEGRRQRAIDWCCGFVIASQLRRDVWEKRLKREDYSYSAGPIYALATLHPSFAASCPMDLPKLSDAEIEDNIDSIGDSVVELYDLRLKALAARRTANSDRAKVGRNDPCPCGSGKKYKRCCRR